MDTKIYPHDRVLAATFLKIVPVSVRPNHVTVFRLLCTPIALFLLAYERYEYGVPVFLFLAFTDVVDGSLARTRGQVTAWGMLWDPVVDKILIGSVLAVLLFRQFPIAIFLTLLGVECIFLVGGYLRKRKGIVTGANWWGKIKMVCQVAAVMSYLLYLESGSPTLQNGSFVLFGLSMFLAFCSLLAHGL
jgi:CDP-diacylglycerol--glycerol-3-phosphate 3-phosphatidyltransferase